MGEHIRAFDWAATPLGPPEQWPLPLRTAVRILLTTGHPAFIFWGPELRCFYNDAYSRSIGPEKHPGILGGPGRDAWPEIWHIIGPQIDYVMTAKGSTWHENALVPIIRHGKRKMSTGPTATAPSTSRVRPTASAVCWCSAPRRPNRSLPPSASRPPRDAGGNCSTRRRASCASSGPAACLRVRHAELLQLVGRRTCWEVGRRGAALGGGAGLYRVARRGVPHRRSLPGPRRHHGPADVSRAAGRRALPRLRLPAHPG